MELLKHFLPLRGVVLTALLQVTSEFNVFLHIINLAGPEIVLFNDGVGLGVAVLYPDLGRRREGDKGRRKQRKDSNEGVFKHGNP